MSKRKFDSIEDFLIKGAIIELLKEIEKWPDLKRHATYAIGRHLLLGYSREDQYSRDKKKHENQIRDVIEKIKKL